MVVYDIANARLAWANSLSCGPFGTLKAVMGHRVVFVIVALGLWISGASFGLAADPLGVESLIQAYPDVLERIEGKELVWRDGTRMSIDDGRGPKTHEALLQAPDIKDVFAQPYPADAPLSALPPHNFDPGRMRPAELFDKLYGDCRRQEVERDLVAVVWLPKRYGKTVRFQARHGAAQRLAAVSARLDALPASFDRYLWPLAGTYNCRVIAGTDRVSAHGYGIAIDLATANADYWRWGGGAYRNQIPQEIVAAFEAEGFIWGGRWSHFDTMHFEYRPELFGGVVR
jgi:hypothetical protein